MNSIKSLVNSFDKFYPNSTFDDSVILQINDIPEEEEEEGEDDRQKTLVPIKLQTDKSLTDSKDSLSEKHTQQVEIEEEDNNEEEEDDEEEVDEEEEEEEEDDDEDSINLIEEKKKLDIDSVKSHHDEQFRLQTHQDQQSILFSIIIFILRCVIFLPNNLIIKPILYAYYIITFPIRYTTQQFGSTSYTLKTEDESQISPAIIPEEINDPFVTRANTKTTATTTTTTTNKPTPQEAELPSLDECYDKKTEQIKHNNFISNTMKSPTSFSKYMIPPPQRLFPLSRNPEKRRRKKILILDLDETLIHSLSRGSPVHLILQLLRK